MTRPKRLTKISPAQIRAFVLLAAAIGVLYAQSAASAQTQPQHPNAGGWRRHAEMHSWIRQRGMSQGALAGLDPATRAILTKMRQANNTLAYEGEQTTILYRPERPVVQSTQTVYCNGEQAVRVEYHSPPRIAGEIVVARSDKSWHYIPSRNTLEIGGPHMRRATAPIGPALRALQMGWAHASIIGSDTVAGHSATVLQIVGDPQTPAGSEKLWIDPDTGAQLRVEVYDTDGNPLSTSYFTQITYAPQFPANTFDPPAAPPGVKVVVRQRPQQLNHIPTDAEAGFHVLMPSYIPAGYQFKSASTFSFAGGKAVGIRYASDLSVLSIFERVIPAVTQAPPVSPRTGMVIVRRNGMEMVAIGTLSNDELQRVLDSMQ